MAYPTIVVLLALVQFIVLGLRVGAARGRYGVAAPATTGHEIFERHYRVQMNTLEQLVIFVPATLAFASFVSPLWAAALGVVFIVGRTVYALSYVADPARRGPGFLLTALPNIALVAGGLWGAVASLLQA
jgi:uncharacterized membrane protein YecN with MAPEG domain